MGTVTRKMVERGGQVGLSIQCSRLGIKIVAARVCPWCFKISIKVSFRV